MRDISIDRVTQAYYGELGTDFSGKTRERINWIVKQVEGKNVLDIGCSQGIASILLGREGKNVDAIDLSKESIKYAEKELEKEHSSVKELVTFRLANFMTDNLLKHEYDTILLTEVLEHIGNPEHFLQKIKSHLKLNGKLIVTVPFGINDFIDHKQTYYYSNLVEQLVPFFKVEAVDYLGKWIGVMCSVSDDNDLQPNIYSKHSVSQLEDAFYQIERDYVNKINDYTRGNSDNKERLRELQKKELLFNELNSSVIKKDEYIRQLQFEVIELLNREEEALKSAIAKAYKIEDLTKEIGNMEHRYNALKRSRLGRLQIRYWWLRKKLAGRGKK
ncbi:2-polyprenyl-6-hydroxyphenyl methylase/3-demethylubiquinone-9 3-methyltransferase [Metabacillus crassostreae]|uniref:methyltransferase domain-containing protein n=1 Tax=Metabacillus crassostreae TaxID=929098 RepID=UPI00195C934F|nr:methyltransferase domain-containing protein [Metabacillus crassostreae]MBM7606269.1 2-polyprenyl-6-hydroxyphenyl methylase/3-demethylubiquinone-9 3-methyltransferase [Metabacillus crassostreae]